MAKEMTSELRYKDGTPMRKYNSPKLQAIEMENKQTAVEWLIKQVESPNWLNIHAWHKKEVFEHGKRIEKQNKIDFLVWIKENRWHVYKNGKWFTTTDQPYIDGEPRKTYTEEQVIQKYEQDRKENNN
jgi:hypothetical protein